MKKSAKALSLVAFHDSVNDTLELASLLRNKGIQAQARHVEDLPQLHEMLRSGDVDLVLHLNSLTEPTLVQVVKAVAIQLGAIPVLSMTETYSVEELNRVVASGGTDLINLDNAEHVLLVLRREGERVHCGRNLIKLDALQQESERRCKTLMQSSRDAIAYIHSGMHIDANDVYLETLGFKSLEDMEGSPLLDLVLPSDHAKVRELIRGVQPNASEVQQLDNIHFKHQNGSEFNACVEFSPASIDGEPCTQVLIRVTTDVDTRALEEKIALLRQRDSLTGLLNRQYYLEQLGKKLAMAHADQANFNLIHLQISYPPNIRNKIGVVGRDALISEAGRLIEGATCADALVSLYSSNVFSILIPNQNDTHQTALEHAHEIANKLVIQMNEHIFEAGGQSVTVHASAGVVMLDKLSPPLGELLRRAERVTAEAAENPQEAVVIYKPKEKDASQTEKDEHWNRLIQDALRNHQFRLFFQPILSLNSDTRRQRYEVFLRLLDEQRQLIQPNEFIESAERSGISIDIDRYVILGAIRHVVDARKRGLSLQLFVRISTPTLLSDDFYPWLSSQIIEAQIYDGGLLLQISEAVALEQLKQAQQLLENLQHIHSTLLIDGMGLSMDSVQILDRLNAPWVKLDRELVHGIATQKSNQARLLELIRTIKQHEGTQVIVPQIEDAASLQVVAMSGTDFLQGNFIQGLSDRLDFDFNSF
jgi:diguanylate cyclase (GGDEF)-like protein/PAS domain S-box-containing protein